MVAESGYAEVRLSMKEKSDFGGYLLFVGAAVGAMIVGTGIVVAFWAIWCAIFGSSPKLMGYSRFWIDSCSAPFYTLFVVYFVGYIISEWEEYVEEVDHFGSFWDFLKDDWTYLWTFILVIVNIALSIPFSLVLGLVIYIAVAIVLVCVWAASRVAGWIASFSNELGGAAKEN